MVTALEPSGKVCSLRVVLCAMASHLQSTYPGPWQHARVQKTLVTSPLPSQLLVLQYTSPLDGHFLPVPSRGQYCLPSFFFSSFFKLLFLFI